MQFYFCILLANHRQKETIDTITLWHSESVESVLVMKNLFTFQFMPVKPKRHATKKVNMVERKQAKKAMK